MIIPVILAGGSGTRLWPMSRELYPKQLLRLTGSLTMLQQTLLRVAEIENTLPPVLVCNREHRHAISRQVRELKMNKNPEMILEPFGRNTAPAVAVGAMMALLQDPEARILVLPADHLLGDKEVFRRAVHTADCHAAGRYLITFGVVPDSPETGYGYIRRGRRLDKAEAGENDPGAYLIDRFVEKPDLRTAESYLASGRYLWNSGMFLFRAADVYGELEKFAPQIAGSCRRAWQKARKEDGAYCLDPEAFSQCPSDSIDYAVMEKTDKGAMVPLDTAWSDLGSWAAMWEAGEKDGDGNVISGEVIARQLKNSLVFSGHRLVAVLGMEDSVVVDTRDALLVASRGRSQDVKSVAETLREENRKEALSHTVSYAGWGSKTVVWEDEGVNVSRISIEPSAELETAPPERFMLHWTVVSGSGLVYLEGVQYEVQKGASLDISPAKTAKAENRGDAPLVIMEMRLPA